MEIFKRIITNTGYPEDIKNVSEKTKDMLQKIQNDLDGDFRDYHNHIVGVKESNNGNFVNAEMRSWRHPIKKTMFLAYKNAGKIKTFDNADKEYIDYFVRMINNIGMSSKFYILGFDKYYDANGKSDNSMTEFYVSNEYIYKLSKEFPNIFIPVISVNPRREDAIDELAKYAELGVRYVKWLPNSMGFSPADKNFKKYYETMAKFGMILLSHTGYEAAVDAAEFQKFGNPLLLRYPLNCGVKVIAAHCATEGKDIDLDSQSNERIESYKLFIRMMDEDKYNGLLYGDISALTLRNRKLNVIKEIISRKDLHHRLVNGSDYPLPAINILIHLNYFSNSGFITKDEKKMLKEVFKYNPLLFDYALKRLITNPDNGDKFSPIIFQNDLLHNSQ